MSINMSYSTTYTDTQTFTVTHAKHMAAKVATDLKRMQRFYGVPSDGDIADYEKEAIEFLKAGYLKAVTYGFKRDGAWIEPTLRYTAQDLAGSAANDDDPGRIKPGCSTANASFYSFMEYSDSWFALLDAQKNTFKANLPFERGSATSPSVNGQFVQDLTYSAGGMALNRSIVRNSA